jgi:hypothetical protein
MVLQSQLSIIVPTPVYRGTCSYIKELYQAGGIHPVATKVPAAEAPVPYKNYGKTHPDDALQ